MAGVSIADSLFAAFLQSTAFPACSEKPFLAD
jgi:hypothetical protein